jgi:predicted nucleic acid-binding protein
LPIVLDASTTLAAVLPDEQTRFAEKALAIALEEGFAVPVLWLYEVQNALVVANRRGRLTAHQTRDALTILCSFAPVVYPPAGLGQEFKLAQTHDLTAYDAAYVAVALATDAQLATSDKRLRAAAKKAGIAIFTG